MIDSNIYTYEDFSISVETNAANFMDFIENYTFFKLANKPLIQNVKLYFQESYDLAEFVKTIPDDASLLREVDAIIAGVRRYFIYEKNNEKWYYFENYGAIYVNFENNTIKSFYAAEVSTNEITPFIMFFVHPILRTIWKFNYNFVHAACLQIMGKNILITGVSGRGKSTATYALIKRGHIALTDETTLIKKVNDRYSVYTITNWLKIDKNAKKQLFSEHEGSFITCEDEYILKISDTNNNSITKANKIDHIFILEQTGKPQTSIQTVGALDVVSELFPTTINILNTERTEGIFTSLMELLQEVKLSRVYFGTDMMHFAQQIERELES